MAKKEERKYWDYPGFFITIVFFVLWLVGFGLLAYHGATVDSIKPREEVLPWNNDVENAVEIAEIENHNTLFVNVAGIFSATSVANDTVATTTLNIDTPEQFASLVPENEKIYVDVSVTNDYEAHYVDRTYYAFIENRTGLYRYNEHYQKDGYEPVSTNEDGILFRENVDSENGARFWIVVIGLLGAFLSLVFIIWTSCAWQNAVAYGPWYSRNSDSDFYYA